MWIFGYGSLVWRPGFDFIESKTVAIEGFVRRFWQGSPDHRGTPDRPGRVVTLVTPEALTGMEPSRLLTWGVAYRIAERDASSVLDLLDVREIAGYERLEVEGHTESGRSIGTVVTYRAGPNNPSYLGPATLSEMVLQISSACGASGTNADYLTRLAHALSARGICDPHVADLAQRVGESINQD